MYRSINAADRLFGMELADGAVLLAVFFLTFTFNRTGALLNFAVLIAAYFGLRVLKRGKPEGYVRDLTHYVLASRFMGVTPFEEAETSGLELGIGLDRTGREHAVRGRREFVFKNDQTAAVGADGRRGKDRLEALGARPSRQFLGEGEVVRTQEVRLGDVQGGAVVGIRQVQTARQAGLEAADRLRRQVSGSPADLPQLLAPAALGRAREVQNAELAQGVVAP